MIAEATMTVTSDVPSSGVTSDRPNLYHPWTIIFNAAG